MCNRRKATVTIADEWGSPLADALVSGRLLEDCRTGQPVTGNTDASGVPSWTCQGPCGAGAIALQAENVSLGTRRFDRIRGTLASCVAGRVCTLDGSGSCDPDGSIAAYRWTTSDGTVLASHAVFTHTFAKAGRTSVTLRVTDNGGPSASSKLSFTVLR